MTSLDPIINLLLRAETERVGGNDAQASDLCAVAVAELAEAMGVQERGVEAISSIVVDAIHAGQSDYDAAHGTLIREEKP